MPDVAIRRGLPGSFMGSCGVDAVAGLTGFHLDEIEVGKTIITNSARTCILADSSTLGRVAPQRVCSPRSQIGVNGLITEHNSSQAVAAAIEQAGGVVLAA
jgi:DeoR/GlpR family transcriptional regulator of sugar metabolism